MNRERRVYFDISSGRLSAKPALYIVSPSVPLFRHRPVILRVYISRPSLQVYQSVHENSYDTYGVGLGS